MKFMFSGALLRFADFSREIEVSGSTLDTALKDLVEARPQLQSVLFDGAGNLRLSHQMFLNGEGMERRYYTDRRAREELALGQTDSVYFLTAIAGG